MSISLVPSTETAPVFAPPEPAPTPSPRRRKKRDPQARPDPSDLRKRSAPAREAALLCVERARLLSAADRAALTAVFRDGMTVKQLAALQTASDRDARALRRHLRRTSARLLSQKFEFVTPFLEPADQAERHYLGLPCWPPKRCAVAEACIVEGRSRRKAAAALGMTLYAIRHEMNAINALFDAEKTNMRVQC